jgi:hypothetical protein
MLAYQLDPTLLPISTPDLAHELGTAFGVDVICFAQLVTAGGILAQLDTMIIE